MKNILFKKITIFDLSPRDPADPSSTARLHRYLTLLRFLHRPASVISAFAVLFLMAFSRGLSTEFKILFVVLLVIAFYPSWGYLLSVYLYNTKRYQMAHWVAYGTIPFLLLGIGIFGCILLF